MGRAARIYKRKTNRADIIESTMKKAITEVVLKKNTIRGAANKYGINKSTLFKRIKTFRSQNIVLRDRDDSGNSSEDEPTVLGRKSYY